MFRKNWLNKPRSPDATCMALILPASVQAAAGAPVAARTGNAQQVRNALKPANAPKRDSDEVIVDPEAVTMASAVRRASSNEQEDAREDHQEHSQPEQKHIDLNG